MTGGGSNNCRYFREPEVVLSESTVRVSHIHYRVIGGRGIYWASDVEPRESGGSLGRGRHPNIYIGGVRREAHAVGRWAGRTERAYARLPRHDRGRESCGGGS